ncbi:MAG TPA: FecR domain-containing protein [Candidatus Methylacidiphilales bacterium]|jgi:biopolymer transport protein ExbD|nr:FecR domain-containing protein [Candidatus Methylacidiphilales bacterium]
MQKVNRLILVSLLTATTTGGAWATEGPIETPQGAEYKRSDKNCYLLNDVVKAHLTAVIVAEGSYTRNGDSYFFTPQKKAPRAIYIETLNDWVEPITPPGATSLGIAPDAMQIREPQGDVEVALPSAPANFLPATDGMTLPDGAVVKTGANGTAAVLFGGVDSARLMPDSAAAVQQTVTAQSRSVEVDLTSGGVFSKVGTQVGVQGDYEVHTPFGNASAHGGDFVTIISGSRTDVCVAQGTVGLEHPDSKTAESATSDDTGTLKILRFPQISDFRQALTADTETLTAILNFIPMANQKIKALRDKAAGGTTLTADEQAYLNRIKQVPALVKLALVKPAAPAPKPAVAITPPVVPLAPAVSTPASAPAPPAIPVAPAVAEPAPAPANPPLKPLRAVVRVDGKVNFQGATYELPGFKSKLEALMKTNPDQPIVIRAGKTVPYENFEAALVICHSIPVKNLTTYAPPPPFATPGGPMETPAPNPPIPGLLMHPTMEPMSAPPPEAPSAPATTNAPPPAGP